jgi:hypothetical protein
MESELSKPRISFRFEIAFILSLKVGAFGIVRGKQNAAITDG